jgi:hypothetical protein
MVLIGIFCCSYQIKDINKSWNRFNNRNDIKISDLEKGSYGQTFFWLTDSLKTI